MEEIASAWLLRGGVDLPCPNEHGIFSPFWGCLALYLAGSILVTLILDRLRVYLINREMMSRNGESDEKVICK